MHILTEFQYNRSFCNPIRILVAMYPRPQLRANAQMCHIDIFVGIYKYDPFNIYFFFFSKILLFNIYSTDMISLWGSSIIFFYFHAFSNKYYVSLASSPLTT